MGSEIQKVIFNLEVIESEFRRNGFDKEMGKDLTGRNFTVFLRWNRAVFY